MNQEQSELYRRIEAFEIDEGTPELTFADRLASEQGWDRGFADRVIAEYRRFVFLGTVSGHPVSPSQAVDEAWHLHLTYTRSYWDRLCAQVLKRPLHHGPTRGGSAEDAKHRDWYARTLASYRTFFGEPPADIWPTPVEKPHRDPSAEPTPAYGAAIGATGLFALALAPGLMTLVSFVQARNWNPFALNGPDFLGYYILLFIFAAVIAGRLRRRLRLPADELGNKRTLALTPYEVAYLAGGPVQAVNSAIAALVDRGSLEVVEGTALGVLAKGPKATDPLERGIIDSAGAGSAVSHVRSSTAAAVDEIKQSLIEQGLLVNGSAVAAARWIPLLFALSVVGIGVARIVQSLPYHTPIGLLVALCVVTSIISLAAFARRPFRSRRGDQALQHLRTHHAKLQAKGAGLVGSPKLAMGVALFGTAVLAGSELASLQRTLTPPAGSGSSCGSSCSSSDGGGSSCGSSCGGGGCGGGGGD